MCAFFLLHISGSSANSIDISEILNSKETPSGVVFEIATGKREYLAKVMPELSTRIKEIHARFPGLPIAIVTHGKESLILTTDKQESHATVHKEIQSLVKNEDVNVHVCGTYASWYHKQDSDFPEYINVAPAGPVQVNDYIDLGYIHIRI